MRSDRAQYVAQAPLQAAKLFVPLSHRSGHAGGERRLDVAEFIRIARTVGADPFKMRRAAGDGSPVPC